MADKTGVDYADKKIDRSGVIPLSNPHRSYEDDGTPIRYNLSGASSIYSDPGYDPFETETPLNNVGNLVRGPRRLNRNIGDIGNLSSSQYTDRLADAQSNWGKIGNALLNNVVIAGTTAVGGVAGLVDGVFETAATGDPSKMWDNETNNLMERIQSTTAEMFPILRDSNYDSESVFKRMGSTVFWADFIQNMGFTEGMLVPGMAAGKLVESAPALLRYAVPSLVSSIGEASTEAVNSKNDELQTKEQMLADTFRERYNAAQSDEERQSLVDSYYESIGRIEEDVRKAGNFVYLSNIGLLSLTNALEFGKVFSKGYDTGRRLNNAVKKTSEKGFGKKLGNDILDYSTDASGAVESTMGRIANESMTKEVIKGTGRGLLNNVSEGFEEFSQDFITHAPMYYKPYDTFNDSIFNQDKRQQTSSMWQSSIMALSDIVNDPNTWTDVAMGFLTGAVGMPRLMKNRKFSPHVEGGLAGEISSHVKEANKANSLISRINDRLENDSTLKTYYDGIVRHLVAQDEMNLALDNADVKSYKDAESKQLISDIMMFDDAGRLDLLKSLYGHNMNLSDDEIKSIINETTDKKGNGPFAINGNKSSVEDARSLIEKKSQYLVNAIDNYAKDKEMFTSAYPELSDESLQSALFIKNQLRDWGARKNDLVDSAFDGVKKVVESASTENNPASITLTSPKSFIESFSRSKEYREDVLDYLSDPRSEVSYDERSRIIEQLSDIGKIDKSMKAYSADLMKILTEPQKSNAKEENRKKNAEEQQKKAETERRIVSAKSARSYGDLENLFQKSVLEDMSDDEQNVLDSAHTELTTSLSKAVSFVKTFNALIDKDTDSSITPAEDRITPETASQLKDYMLEKFRNAKSYDEVTNPAYSVSDDRFTPEELAKVNDRFNNYTLAAVRDINAKERISSPTSNPTSTVPTATSGKDDVAVPPSAARTYASPARTIEGIIDANEKGESLSILKNSAQVLSESYLEFKKNPTPKNRESLYRALETLENDLEGSVIDSKLDLRAEYDVQANRIREEIEMEEPSSQDEEGDVEKDNLSSAEPVSGKKDYYRNSITEYALDTVSPKDVNGNEKKNFRPTFKLFKDYEDEKGNPSYDAVWDLLNDPNASGTGISAFEYVNKGKLHPGDKLSLSFQKVGEHEVIVQKKGNQIVGVMPGENSSYTGISKVYEAVRAGKEVTLTVSKIYLGQYKYTPGETRGIDEIGIAADKIQLAVYANGHLVTNVDGLSESDMEKLSVTDNNRGAVYILLDSATGKKVAKRIRVHHFNKGEFDLMKLKDSGNVTASNIYAALNRLASAQNNTDVFNAILELKRYLVLPRIFHSNLMDGEDSKYLAFHGIVDGKPFTRSVNVGRMKDTESEAQTKNSAISLVSEGYVPNDPSEIFNELLGMMYSVNPQFAVNADTRAIKHADGEHINSGDYNQRLVRDGLLYTYLQTSEMKNAWFTTSYYDDSLVEHIPSNPEAVKSVRRTSDGFNVTVEGVKYYFENETVYDQSGAIANIPDDTRLLIKDIADVYKQYGNSLNGAYMYRGKAKINNRYVNIIKGKRLTKDEITELDDHFANRPSISAVTRASIAALLGDQENVKRLDNGRPDNENGYKIREADGEYHIYERVHSVIPSQYSDSANSSAAFREAGVNATNNGQHVDTLSRMILSKRFTIEEIASLSSEEVLSEYNMDDKAFKAYLDHMRKMLELAERTGDIYLCDSSNGSIVLYGTDVNGRRIAGEVDAIKYNPVTGDVEVIDFKTSKSEFHIIKDGKEQLAYEYTHNDPENGRNYSSYDMHSFQTNAYRQLFESRYPARITGIKIYPFWIEYEKSGPITKLRGESTISLPTDVNALSIGRQTPASASDNNPVPEVHTSTGTVKVSTKELKNPSNPKSGYKEAVHEVELKYLDTFNGTPVYYYTETEEGKTGATLCTVYITVPTGFSRAASMPTQVGNNGAIDSSIVESMLEQIKSRLVSKPLVIADMLKEKVSVEPISFVTPHTQSVVEAVSSDFSASMDSSDTAKEENPQPYSPEPQSSVSGGYHTWKDLPETIRDALENIANMNEEDFNKLSQEEKDEIIACH